MGIAEELRAATLPFFTSASLVIFTEDCTGRPQKKAGAEEIVSRVSIPELERLRASVDGEGPWRGPAIIGGQQREVLAFRYAPSNALLVLTDPAPTADRCEAQPVRMVTYLWELAAARIQEKVSDAPPSYLLESRAASAERVRVTGELVDQHSTTLETVLAALRSNSLDDRSARTFVTDLTVKALVGLRTLSDRTSNLVEEPVAKAFERLGRTSGHSCISATSTSSSSNRPQTKGIAPARWPTPPGLWFGDWSWLSPNRLMFIGSGRNGTAMVRIC